FGYVAVESMALARPVVASRTGGFPEFIDDGRTGLLVPPGDQAALSRAILDVLCDAEGRERIGTAASAAADRFDVDAIADDLLAVYERAQRETRRGSFDSSVYQRGYRRYFHPEDERDPFRRLYAAKRSAVLAALASGSGKLVDVGGGYGRLAAPLAETYDVTLVDVSQELLDEARRRCPDDVRLVLADARK